MDTNLVKLFQLFRGQYLKAVDRYISLGGCAGDRDCQADRRKRAESGQNAHNNDVVAFRPLFLLCRSILRRGQCGLLNASCAFRGSEKHSE
jgi:hypothetical protein